MKPIFFAYRNGGVRRVCPLVATVVSFTATLPAVAADANWLGNTDASMANGANWDSSPVSGDVWLFGAAGTAGGTLTNDLATSSAFQVGGISFGAAASAYTLSGGAFTLAGNIVSTSANAASIGAGITVSGARQVNLNGTSGVTLTGNLSGSGSLTQTAGGSGAKTLAFSGDNSGFTGTFTQTNDSNNRTAFNAATAGSANAAWDLNRNVNGGVALNFTNSTIHFGALSGGAFIRSNSNGTVNVSVGALGTDTTFGGAFQQANGSAQMSVIKVGAGNLTLTGGSTHTAGTIVNGGTLTLARGGGSGAVRGQITVNAGATVKTTVKDALGYTDGSQVSQVNLVGGTFDNAHADNQGYATQFNLTGGTVGSTGGGSINFFTGYGIASNAAVSTSIVSAPVTLRGGNSMNVAVADGAASVDLEMSGA
ncbi:MAG: autotransporter-associated beta strand repeat-containing protein, partial [Verrucomicrobiae bacterium]|nr:autotransporter-associated beta strand repeat-containing protein [Verrucomicrobiae bacterium]